MAESIEPTFWKRIRHTPMRDVVRGRLTSRLDYRSRIIASDLPGDVQSLINRIINRTRLWRMEKADVANEMLAHFQDGMEAGESVSDLCERFGDVQRSAKLIRRAKKRNRPLIWKIVKGITQSVFVMLLIYCGLLVYFVMGKPSPKSKYLEQFNRDALAVSADQRAWPIYEQVISSIRSNGLTERELSELLTLRPASRGWSKAERFLREHRTDIDAAARATQLPTLGFILDMQGVNNDPQAFIQMRSELENVGNNADYKLYWLAYLIESDAELAMFDGDGSRSVRDMRALLRLSDQLRAQGTIISCLNALGAYGEALSTIETGLHDHTDLMTDADLTALAHLIASPQVAADFYSFRGERLGFYDAVQRMYTDDGKGDGRLTPQGVRLLSWTSVLNAQRNNLFFPSALASQIILGKARSIEEYDSIFDQIEAQYHKPYRDIFAGVDARLAMMASSTINHLRYEVILDSIPLSNFDRLQRGAETTLGERDGLLVGIALEIYRRAHGRYPASLEALVPELLPIIPADRIWGGAVRYRLVDGKPVVYSLGADHKDNGGRPPIAYTATANYLAAQWRIPPDNAPAGDWVLYPAPKDPTPEYDD